VVALSPSTRPKPAIPAQALRTSAPTASGAGSSDGRAPGFGRRANQVLEYLLAASPLSHWVVVRFENSSSGVTAAQTSDAAMLVVAGVGDAFALPVEMDLTRADLRGSLGKLSVRAVQLPESSALRKQFGARSCVAAVVVDPARGSHDPFGAIVGLSADPEVTLPIGFSDQLALHADHLSVALGEHYMSFQREHDQIVDRDAVNGFDTTTSWVDRLHLLDRHCTATGEDAAVAVLNIDGLVETKDRFGREAADEALREISYVLRSLSMPNAYFARLDANRLVCVRLGLSGFDAQYWANDLRRSLVSAVESAPVNLSVRIGMATRIWGQRRSLEVAQTRASKQASGQPVAR
jgi:GGDEF domain-containing protein